MSIFKNKKFGLSALLAIVMLSLALAVLLPVVAEVASIADVYYTITVETDDSNMGTVSITGTTPHSTEVNKYLNGSAVKLTAVAKTGYRFVEWQWTEKGVAMDSPIATRENQVVAEDRVYKAVFAPMEYTISYPTNDHRLQYPSSEPKPEKHTYGTRTRLPIPSTPDGYTFDGWLVVDKDGGEREYAAGEYLGENDIKSDITLRPIYLQNRYDVTCEDRVESKTGDLLGNQKKEYDFETVGSAIPVTDWTPKSYKGFTHDANLYQTLEHPVMVNTDLNVVYRIYKPNTYTALLDNNASDATGGVASVQVVYSKDFPVALLTELPTRTGYVCLGYYLDANGNDKYDQGDVQYCVRDPYAATPSWDASEFRLTDAQFDQFMTSDGKITLKARWEKVPFKLIFNVENSALASKVNITVKSVDGVDYTNRDVPYDTTVNITVKVDDAYKLVKWNGEGVKHTNQQTFSFTVPAQNTQFSLTVLPDDPKMPAFTVDYAGERLVPPSGEVGSFRLEDQDRNDILSFLVNADGTIVGTNSEQKVSITDYLGQKVYLIRCGDGVECADSDPQEITLAGRPAAVVIDPTTFNVAREDHKIEIIFKNGEAPIGWEYACSTVYLAETDAGSLLAVWQDLPVFIDLDPGTTYYVYARKKATETAPHGRWARMGENITPYETYIREQINHLNDLMDEDIAGKNVTELVENAKNALWELVDELYKGSTSFYSDADAIVKHVEDTIPFARIQDRAIAELDVIYKELVDSGKYNEQGLLALGTIYNDAVRDISDADSDIKVKEHQTAAVKAFDLVPISYLVSGDVKIYAEKGMDKAYSLSAKSQADSLASIAPKIYKAINSGSALFPGRATAEFINSLNTKDVLGYYRVKLSYREDMGIHTVAQGPYEIRLMLPEELRDDTGFVVVYYNESTGEITVLEATRSGNELIFIAQSVEDFVILGDHAVNLLGVCIALFVLALAQIVAISVIVHRRRNYKKAMRMNGFALPVVALAVRFYPIPVVQAVAVLTMLVVILQIILILLLIKTDVVPRRRRRMHQSYAPRAEGDAYAESAQVTAEAAPESIEETDTVPVSEELSDDEALPMDYDEEIEVAIDEASEFEGASYEDGTFEEAGEAVEAEGEWYGDEDFIEPAPNPAYSLPEDGEAYIQEDETANGYSLEYDSNGYTLEYDNETVEYTDEEFDGEGEGFVEYTEDEGVSFEAYDDQANDQSEDYVAEEEPLEAVDYGYDVEADDEDAVVYYDYAEAQDVIREDDEVSDQ